MDKRIQLSGELKDQAIDDLKRFFEMERGEEIGNLAAETLLDYIIENIAPNFYNQGIRDSIAYVSDKVEDLYSLEIVRR